MKAAEEYNMIRRLTRMINLGAEAIMIKLAEAEAFGRLLGSHVQRLATIAHGDGVCTLHVPHPVASPPQRPEYPEHHQEKESA